MNDECPTVARLADNAVANMSRDWLLEIITTDTTGSSFRQHVIDELMCVHEVTEEQAATLADMRAEFIAALRRRILH